MSNGSADPVQPGGKSSASFTQLKRGFLSLLKLQSFRAVAVMASRARSLEVRQDESIVPRPCGVDVGVEN